MKGNLLFEFLKAPVAMFLTGAAAVASPNSYPLWMLILASSGVFFLLVVIGALFSTAKSPLRIEVRLQRVFYQEIGEGAGFISNRNIVVHNKGEKVVEEIRVAVTAIKMPPPLKAPEDISVEMAPQYDRQLRLLGGDSMSFVLLRDVWRVKPS